MSENDVYGVGIVLACAAAAVYLVSLGGREKAALAAPVDAADDQPQLAPLRRVPPEMARQFRTRKGGVESFDLLTELELLTKLRSGQLNERDEVLEVGSEDWLPIGHTDLAAKALPVSRSANRAPSMSAEGRALVAQAEALHKVGGWMYLVNPLAAFGMRRAAKSLKQAGEDL